MSFACSRSRKSSSIDQCFLFTFWAKQWKVFKYRIGAYLCSCLILANGAKYPFDFIQSKTNPQIFYPKPHKGLALIWLLD